MVLWEYSEIAILVFIIKNQEEPLFLHSYNITEEWYIVEIDIYFLPLNFCFFLIIDCCLDIWNIFLRHFMIR